MTRWLALTLLLCAVATAPLAAEGHYRCEVVAAPPWQGIPDPAANALHVEPGWIEFTLDAATGLYQGIDGGQLVGPPVQLEVRDWAGNATRGLPQIIADHPDGDFSIRIALDNDPLRFALLFPVSVATGTCIIESAVK